MASRRLRRRQSELGIASSPFRFTCEEHEQDAAEGEDTCNSMSELRRQERGHFQNVLRYQSENSTFASTDGLTRRSAEPLLLSNQPFSRPQKKFRVPKQRAKNHQPSPARPPCVLQYPMLSAYPSLIHAPRDRQAIAALVFDQRLCTSAPGVLGGPSTCVLFTQAAWPGRASNPS
jgi:hypothetical protein